MEICLLKKGSKKLILGIEKKYISEKPVISLGSDCHPAKILQILNIRTISFPFDWVYTIASTGMEYVMDNILTEFNKFADRICLNQWGEVASAWYENSAFFHYDDLLHNTEMQETLKRRGKRFLSYFNTTPCVFLHNVPTQGLTTREECDRFLTSVEEFLKINKTGHELRIYIRFDEKEDEYRENADYVLKELNTIPGIRAVHYVRYREKYGVWGDKRSYTKLLRDLGIELKKGFPRISLSWKNISEDSSLATEG